MECGLVPAKISKLTLNTTKITNVNILLELNIMAHLPVSDNDRTMVKNMIAQGATEQEAWDLVDDFYLEMENDELISQ